MAAAVSEDGRSPPHAVGELAILAVEIVSDGSITKRDAIRAGYQSRDELVRELASGIEGILYRIEFRFAGPDSRTALREQTALSEGNYTEIARRLKRYDASAREPWTLRVVRLIADHPKLRAGELAQIGKFDKEWLKVNIRKLKDQGLTASLATGYALSPRGRAFLDRVASASFE